MNIENEKDIKIKIGRKEIGTGAPCYIISEIGNNHGANLETAKKMIKASFATGADAVKFQTFKALDIVNPNVPANAYSGWNVSDKFDYWYQFVETLEMPYEWYDELIGYTRSLGLAFISTPASMEAALFLAEKKVDAIKIASMDLNNLPFLREIDKLGLPVILSTGMSRLEEIEEAVQSFKKAPLALLHCVSNYPLKPEEANLLNIKMLRDHFSRPVGFSNHALGYDLDLVAIGLGACIIEKHFTLDRNDPKPAEHHFSMLPEEMKEMVLKIRVIEKALGSRNREVSGKELKNRELIRRSITVLEDIKKGDIIKSESLGFIRPGTGIEPKNINKIIGKKARRAMNAYDLVKWEDLE
ncbi:MAG: N-acetylneuraminate synthase family protein [Candidatus Margulisbacteria bacterium]|nr:N-acetylneuraminate synthase family protein [Candidatus Margulisiibacteriota bacterium]MBU1617119.1 N-acetylneuraminate synthase family protein [Candidatus Margulisiibacteriota bacterium]